MTTRKIQIEIDRCTHCPSMGEVDYSYAEGHTAFCFFSGRAGVYLVPSIGRGSSNYWNIPDNCPRLQDD